MSVDTENDVKNLVLMQVYEHEICDIIEDDVASQVSRPKAFKTQSPRKQR